MEISYIGKCLLISEKGKKILIIGDLHLGYEEVLNQGGVFVTRKMFDEMIDYFNEVFDKIGKMDKIILLGDVKHNFGGILKQEWNDVLELIDYLSEKIEKEGEIVIVKGNHDTILAPILKRREGIKLVDYFIFEEIGFLHGDKDFKEIYDKKIKYWILGHGHPAVKIREGVKTEKYKCFLEGKFKGKKVFVVPSFFEYNDGCDPRDSNLGMAWNFDFMKFRVEVVGENLEVLDFGELGKLR